MRLKRFTLNAGETQTWSLNANETKVYVFSLANTTTTYESFVQVTSGEGLGYVMQQRYGPPQLTYVDTLPGHSQFSGGPVMVNGDIQRIAIEVGPASIASGGTIVVSQV